MSPDLADNILRIAVGAVVMSIAWATCVVIYAFFKGDE
jgi:hypothetical protein